MNIEIQIQTLCRKHQITQEMLAVEIDVTVSAVSKWKNSATMSPLCGRHCKKY